MDVDACIPYIYTTCTDILAFWHVGEKTPYKQCDFMTLAGFLSTPFQENKSKDKHALP